MYPSSGAHIVEQDRQLNVAHLLNHLEGQVEVLWVSFKASQELSVFWQVDSVSIRRLAILDLVYGSDRQAVVF